MENFLKIKEVSVGNYEIIVDIEKYISIHNTKEIVKKFINVIKANNLIKYG